MRILAIEHELVSLDSSTAPELLRVEASALWELYLEGTVHTCHFRADRHEAVLMLEADGLSAATKALERLPLVQTGFIEFELIPLSPYDGFARLFDTRP